MKFTFQYPNLRLIESSPHVERQRRLFLLKCAQKLMSGMENVRPTLHSHLDQFPIPGSQPAKGFDSLKLEPPCLFGFMADDLTGLPVITVFLESLYSFSRT